MPVVRISLMWDNFPGLTTRLRREAAMRYFGSVVLCALLLFFCTNARLARYEVAKNTPKLASTQAYFDGEEIRKELSQTALLVSLAIVVAVLLPIREKATLVPVALWSSPPFNGFNPEFCLRPPPVR
jgi:hypothetical protein